MQVCLCSGTTSQVCCMFGVICLTSVFLSTIMEKFTVDVAIFGEQRRATGWSSLGLTGANDKGSPPLVVPPRSGHKHFV